MSAEAAFALVPKQHRRHIYDCLRSFSVGYTPPEHVAAGRCRRKKDDGDEARRTRVA